MDHEHHAGWLAGWYGVEAKEACFSKLNTERMAGFARGGVESSLVWLDKDNV